MISLFKKGSLKIRKLCYTVLWKSYDISHLIFDMIQEVEFLLSIARRRVKNIVIYATNRCNSRCRTCDIWNQKLKIDIEPSLVSRIIKGLDKRVLIKLTGGEFLLHPEYREILRRFDGYHRTLFSNGILADKLIETVREFGIEEISISCDGVGSRYREIRGVDNFGNIQKIVRKLEKKTKITVNYTISPFNTKEDLRQVADFCNQCNVKLIVGGYNLPEYFSAKEALGRSYDLDGIKFKRGHLLCPEFFLKKYVKYYNDWLKGVHKIPCFSVRCQAAVYPDGSVSLCEARRTELGNLNEADFIGIWNSALTTKVQKENKNCNGCFMICAKPYDMVLAPLSKFIK